MISKYISIEEATDSPTAKRFGIKNIPNPKQLENMKYVGVNLFDKIRDHFGKPIKVNSFLRVKKLNDAVGSTDSSFHLHGCAIDITCIKETGVTNAMIFNYVKDLCDFTELIWEYGTDIEPNWVHIALMKGREKEKKVKRINK